MDPLSTPPIHVVGGGIGGLAVAVALHRRGFDVHVHEAAPNFGHVGGGHWLYANALFALDAIAANKRSLADSAPVERELADSTPVERELADSAPDLRANMTALGRPFDGFRFITQRGRELLFESTAPYTPRPELAPVVLHRADIIDQLARLLPPERLHFGRRLARCEAKTLVFDDGTRVDAPIIIGADGIHSRVRQDQLSTTPARFVGQTGIWGISDHVLPEGTPAHFTEVWGNGVRMGFTYVGTEGVYWFLVVRQRVSSKDPAELKAFVMEHAVNFPDALSESVRQTPLSRLQVNPLFDLNPPRRWWNGSVCALGDAVHACTPNLGQGGCQALEDAVCLSTQIAEQPTLDAAFRTFERLRRRRTTAIVFLARWLGNLAQSRGVWAKLRNVVVWLGPAWLLRPLLRWINVGQAR